VSPATSDTTARSQRGLNLRYLRYELLRLFRNKRSFIFSLVFPLALFLVIGGSNKDQVMDLGTYQVKFVLYYMVSMAGYGAMIAAISGGARIATERQTGWNRQLRLTPLPVGTYFGTKVISSYVMSAASIVLLYAAGLAFGVRIDSAWRWVSMTGLLLIGVLPFVAMGIAVGHLLTTDAMGPAVGGGSAFFGFLGGQWFPLPQTGVLRQIGELVPSFWITQASHIGIGGTAWPLKGWLVIGIWAAVMSAWAAWAYRRDTNRI
jgi:ABC-2 type transport system permease protein